MGTPPVGLSVLAPREREIEAGAPMPASARQRVANALDYASDRNVTLGPLTGMWSSMSRTDAYVIQTLVSLRKQEHGATVRGHKIGMVAAENCRMLGMRDPTAGPIFAHQILPSGSRISTGTLIRPWLEAEVALLLGTDLVAPITAADVLGATRAVVPVLEILDTRLSWEIRSEDSIADLASSGRVLVGEPAPVPSAAALRRLAVTLEADGRVLRTGHADAIGGIAQSAARLVNELGSRGQDARAGQLLLTGSFCAATRLPRGANVRASFGALGDVLLRTV